MIAIRLFGAVRKSSEGSPFSEWVDSSALCYDKDDCLTRAEKLNQQLPDWAELHPILRISEFRIVEVTDSDGA